MVATLLRLKLQILANLFRRSRWQKAGIVIGLVVAVAVAALGILGLVLLRGATADDARTPVVLLGALIVLGFVLGPLVFGAGDTLDPRRFSAFGMRPRGLAAGLVLVALVGLPGLVLTAWLFGAVATWSRGPAPTIAAVVAIPLTLALCSVGSRVTVGLGALTQSTRRPRVLGLTVGSVLLVVVASLAVVVLGTDWTAGSGRVLPSLARAVAWTPFGAPFALPADVAEGQWLMALVELLSCLAATALFAWAWFFVVRGLLSSVDRPGRGRSYAGSGWFERLPAAPAGVIAARTLTYWGRDPRYWTSLVVIPVVPVVMDAALAIAGVPSTVLALLPLPVMCLLLGWSVHNDLAADSTAIWLHVSSGTRGRADRWGRLVPVLGIGVPLVLAGSVLTTALAEDWELLPGVLGLSSCLLLTAAGLSSLLSAAFPYPTPRPGDSPFSQPQSTGPAATVVQALSLLAALVLSIPAAAAFIAGITGDWRWHYLALVLGLGVGVLVLIAGVRTGGRVFERRGPEIVGFAQLFD